MRQSGEDNVSTNTDLFFSSVLSVVRFWVLGPAVDDAGVGDDEVDIGIIVASNQVARR